MAFLDDDDALEPEDPGRSGRSGAPRQRPFIARRLMGLAVGVLLVIVVVLGVKGCLNARKERGFENYVRDLASIATESDQLSKEFFGRLEDPGDLTAASLSAEVSADKGTADNLTDRVQGLDTPGELADSQSELELAFKLRSDGIAGVADQIDATLAKEPPKDAYDVMANYMRYFLSSDVLYGRSRQAIEEELATQDIVPDEKLSTATFLPAPVADWIDATPLQSKLSGISSAGGGECSGVCGVGLVDGGQSINGTVLDSTTTVTVTGGSPYELEVSVQNQGEGEVTDVGVEYTLTGGDESQGSSTIDRIDVGSTETAKLNIQPDPASGDELTLEVNAIPVQGEKIADNNTASYTVVFE